MLEQQSRFLGETRVLASRIKNINI